jgi:hypothetical protein
MKKFFLSALVVIGALTGQVKASETDVFQVNDAQVNAEFAELNKLENFVVNHEGITYDEVVSNHSELTEGLNASPESFTGLGSTLRGGGEAPLGIPAFIWGCVLGWVGILIVYFVAEDREQTKKALYGCLIGWVGGFILYWIIVIAILGGSAFWAL